MESLQSESRGAETGSVYDKLDYQRFEHPALDVLHFSANAFADVVPFGKTYPASVRIYCPEVRVISRVACIFIPKNPNDRSAYNLAMSNNDIVAYRAMNAKTRIARVGEIVGKNGIPYVFPKSDIDGIAFQNEDDLPWIDVEMNLGFPGVEGTWSMFYHATSNNKLKQREWEGYISRVTMSVQASPGTIVFGPGGG
jgi:hypothetical protein